MVGTIKRYTNAYYGCFSCLCNVRRSDKMRIAYWIIIAVLAWYANGLRIDNIDKNKQLESMVSPKDYAELDKKYRDLKCDIEYLREANEALLKYSEPKSVIKAIKHTQLPKMKGA